MSIGFFVTLLVSLVCCASLLSIRTNCQLLRQAISEELLYSQGASAFHPFSLDLVQKFRRLDKVQCQASLRF